MFQVRVTIQRLSEEEITAHTRAAPTPPTSSPTPELHLQSEMPRRRSLRTQQTSSGTLQMPPVTLQTTLRLQTPPRTYQSSVTSSSDFTMRPAATSTPDTTFVTSSSAFPQLTPVNSSDEGGFTTPVGSLEGGFVTPAAGPSAPLTSAGGALSPGYIYQDSYSNC